MLLNIKNILPQQNLRKPLMQALPPPHGQNTWNAHSEKDGGFDGLSLRAASKRYGVHIIVIPLEGEEKDKPMAFGTPRSGREPIVLLLNDRQGHYTLLQLKAGPANGPKNGLKPLKHLLPASLYEAAGSHQLLPEVVLVRPTPGDLRARLSPRPKQSREMGSVKSHGASWRPACTPESSRKTSGMLSQQPPMTRNIKSCTKTAVTVNKPKSKTVSSAVRSVQPVGTGNRKQNKKKGTRATHVSEQFVWTCNLCQQVFQIP